MVSTASSKAKGRRLQQLVRDAILAKYPVLEPDDVKSTAMGQKGEDVQLSPAARKLFPYSVECKARNKIAVYEWYKQANTNSPTKTKPLLVIKQDRAPALAVIDLETFMELLHD